MMIQSPSEDVRKSSFHYLFKQITNLFEQITDIFEETDSLQIVDLNLFEQIDSMFRNKKYSIQCLFVVIKWCDCKN